MQPGPWLRPATNYSPYRIRSKCQRDQATEQPSRNTKQTKEGKDQPPTGKGERGGSSSAGCVCIDGVDSPQPSLVTSVSSREAKPTRTKHKRRQRPKTQRSTTQTQENAKPTRRGGGQQNQPGQKAARRAEPDKEEKGRGGKKASGGQQKRRERTPGKAAETGERKPHRPRRRARAALAES